MKTLEDGDWADGWRGKRSRVGQGGNISRPRLRAIPQLLPLVINSVKPRTRPRRKDVVAEWRVCLHQPWCPHTHPIPSSHPANQPSIHPFVYSTQPHPNTQPPFVSMSVVISAARAPLSLFNKVYSAFFAAFASFFIVCQALTPLSLQICCVYYARFARNWTGYDPGLKHQSTVRLIMVRLWKLCS